MNFQRKKEFEPYTNRYIRHPRDLAIILGSEFDLEEYKNQIGWKNEYIGFECDETNYHYWSQKNNLTALRLTTKRKTCSSSDQGDENLSLKRSRIQ